LVTRRLASRVVVSVGLTLDRDVIAVEGEVVGWLSRSERGG
jgi:hypothetical protein